MSDSMQKQLTIDRLREQLSQAEADRDTLAAEVRAFRKWFDSEWTIELNEPLLYQNAVNARAATDASGALTRAKEAK